METSAIATKGEVPNVSAWTDITAAGFSFHPLNRPTPSCIEEGGSGHAHCRHLHEHDIDTACNTPVTRFFM
eukprot:1068564-Amphidinium_carterae.1